MIQANLQNGIPTQKQAATKLTAALDKNLSAYATAATAAGVGMLMSALPAQAKIVYTPSNIPITQNKGLIPLDLNHDGTPDFQFSNFSYQTHGLGVIFLKVEPTQPTNEIWGAESKGQLCAAALPAGKQVGPKARFQQDPALGLFMDHIGLNSTGETYFGPWHKVETAYLGLKFAVKGKTHFGWARIEFAGQGEFYTARIAGYAYETVPNKPVLTGKKKGPTTISQTERTAAVQGALMPVPAALGLLARGAATLEVWRREKESA
jgi:hypothetical protein